MKKETQSTKRLLIVMIILFLITLSLGIYLYLRGEVGIPAVVKNTIPIKVAELSGNKEQLLGTIIYPGANTLAEITKDQNANTGLFETTDSVQGVVNIYTQDLTNRYPDYSVSKETFRKTDALDGKSVVLICSSDAEKITITIWANKNGLTSIEIKKDSNF